MTYPDFAPADHGNYTPNNPTMTAQPNTMPIMSAMHPAPTNTQPKSITLLNVALVMIMVCATIMSIFMVYVMVTGQ